MADIVEDVISLLLCATGLEGAGGRCNGVACPMGLLELEGDVKRQSDDAQAEMCRMKALQHP